MSSRPFAPITISYALGIVLAYFIPGLPSYLLWDITIVSLLVLLWAPRRMTLVGLLVLSGVIGYFRTPGEVQVWLRGPSAQYQSYQSLRSQKYLNRRGSFAAPTLYSSRDVQNPDRRGGNPFIRLCLRVKRRLVRSLRRYLEPADYGILEGLLFSSKSQMSKAMLSDFRKSGAFHLLSASGIHVTILAWLLGMLIQAKGPSFRGKVKALILIIVTIGHSIMAGGRPAMVRSALMTSLYWGASLVRREVDSLNSLFFAGWLLLIVYPLYLFDLGFQLSFLSVAGLILFTPLFDRVFLWGREQKFPGWLRRVIQSFNSSVSATLAVSPLLAYSTKTFSLISPVANLLAIPLAGGVMAGGLFHCMIGLLHSNLQSYTAKVVQVLIFIFVKVIHFFGNLPFASQEVSSFSPLWLLAIYLPLFLLSSYFYSKPSKDSPPLLEGKGEGMMRPFKKATQILYKAWFILRWFFFYNLELVFLHLLVPKASWKVLKDREVRQYLLSLNQRRTQAQQEIYRILRPYGKICATCGACCLEPVNRFTLFDHTVRLEDKKPVPHYGQDILSLPWILKNGIVHTSKRVWRFLVGKPPEQVEPCPNLGFCGCTLKEVERPMLCASWFCPKYMLAMDPEDLTAIASPLREIERIHREITFLLRRFK